MTFSSDEVNLLVYRYLEESGFRHSAFTFGYESNVLNAGIDGTIVPRGALLSMLQKGVLFSEAEAFALLNDGELEARFEKAIGSLNLLECAMCDATKVKALQRRIQKAAPQSDQQQQSSRVPSRAPQHAGADQSAAVPTTSHATPVVTTTATTNSNSFTIQGANLARPESTSSAKSTFSSSGGARDNRERIQQQQQQQQNSASSNANIVQQQQQQHNQRASTATAGPYRTTSADYGAKIGCFPQVTTSAGTVPSSNHLHPQTAAQLQFYQQLLSHSPLSDGGIGSTPYNITQNVVSNGVLNGPQHQQQQQLASSMASFPTFPGTHHPLSHSLKSSESAATVSEFAARFIANGTGGPPGSAYLSPGTTTTANKQTKGLGTGGNS